MHHLGFRVILFQSEVYKGKTSLIQNFEITA